MFTLTMETDNAAFCDDDEGGHNEAARGAEVARILRWIAERVERGNNLSGAFRDANGNKVGTYTFDNA